MRQHGLDKDAAMSIFHEIGIVWRALPPVPVRMKIGFLKGVLRAVGTDKPGFIPVEARTRVEALQTLRLPAEWDGAAQDLDRHTRGFLTQAWKDERGLGPNVYAIWWAWRLVRHPGDVVIDTDEPRGTLAPTGRSRRR